jgi:hypothetical protein
MRRLFWVALGATAGVLVVRRLTRAASKLTPEGAADRVSGAVGGLTQAVREFSDDVKAGMAERDVELREALGIAENGAVHDVDPTAVGDLLRTDHPRGAH